LQQVRLNNTPVQIHHAAHIVAFTLLMMLDSQEPRQRLLIYHSGDNHSHNELQAQVLAVWLKGFGLAAGLATLGLLDRVLVLAVPAINITRGRGER
jgi:hypothetical protein